MNDSERLLAQINLEARNAIREAHKLSPVPALHRIAELTAPLAPEQYRCAYCLATVPVGHGDVCADCERDGPPCEQCNKRGHAFKDSDDYGFWDEDCDYHDRYRNEPRV